MGRREGRWGSILPEIHGDDEIRKTVSSRTGGGGQNGENSLEDLKEGGGGQEENGESLV